MKQLNRKDLLIYFTIVILLSYLKSIYSFDINEEGNWLYSYFVYFSNNQTVNVIWLIPILAQVFLVSKSTYIALCHFDFRYKNRKKLYFNTIIKTFKLQIIYTIIFLAVQITSIIFFTNNQITWESWIIEFICKYYFETLCFIILLVALTMITSQYTISFIGIVIFIILLLNLYPNAYLPIISLFNGYSINLITIFTSIILIWILRYYYISMNLLGGIKYDTSD